MKSLLRFIVPIEIWLVAVLSAAAMIGIYDWLHPTSIAHDSVIQAARESSVKINVGYSNHGSGVVIGSNGRIITAGHVCKTFNKNYNYNLNVQLWNDKIVPADIIWIATIDKYDLCLIDAQDWYFDDNKMNIKFVKKEPVPINLTKRTINWEVTDFADKEPKIGQSVMHIGNMRSIREAIGFGTIGRATKSWNKQEAYTYMGTTGPGSSGGGVFTLDGKLLGLIISEKGIRLPFGNHVSLGVAHILPYHVIQYALTKS